MYLACECYREYYPKINAIKELTDNITNSESDKTNTNCARKQSRNTKTKMTKCPWTIRLYFLEQDSFVIKTDNTPAQLSRGVYVKEYPRYEHNHALKQNIYFIHDKEELTQGSEITEEDMIEFWDTANRYYRNHIEQGRAIELLKEDKKKMLILEMEKITGRSLYSTLRY